jgi:uncharacterized membrane protein
VLLTAVAAWTFVAWVVVTPVLEARGAGLASLSRAVCGPVCHQLPERTLHVAGLPMAACSRCVGLYVGGAAGLLAFGLLWPAARRVKRRWLLAAVLPTALDLAAPWVGLAGLPDLPRFLLGVPAGFMLGLFLAIGVADWVRMLLEVRPVAASLPTALEDLDG